MRKQDYYEPIIGRESEPRRRPKKKKKRANRGERVVVTLLSLHFLTVAIVATVKYVVRAPEPVTDNEDQQTQQDGTAEDSAAIQTISNGKERKKYCYTILAYGVDNAAGGSDTSSAPFGGTCLPAGRSADLTGHRPVIQHREPLKGKA